MDNTNAQEASIRMFEIHHRSPVVGLVFFKPASCAGSGL